jgi:hypothetical protein
MSGWFLLSIGAVITALDLAAALYLLRRGDGEARLAPGGRPRDSAEAANAGRIILLVSPLVFLVFAALAFGIIPVEAIEPISLGGGQ